MNLVSLQFVYLIFVLMFFPAWMALFIFQRDVRKELLVVGVFNAVAGFFLEWFVWTKDWVHSLTLTHTPAGIEDVLLGFFLAGISTGLFETLSRLRGRKATLYKEGYAVYIKILIGETICLFSALAICRFVPLGHSFYASALAITLLLTVFFCIRRDLMLDSLLTGFGVSLISIPAYLMTFYFNSQFSPSYWQWKNLSGYTFLGIPIEDIIWFFLAGSFLGPLYEFWHDFYFGKR